MWNTIILQSISTLSTLQLRNITLLLYFEQLYMGNIITFKSIPFYLLEGYCGSVPRLLFE